MSQVAVVKTRRMIAQEIAVAVKAGAWEADELRRLSLPMLRRLAVRVVPGFQATDHVEMHD